MKRAVFIVWVLLLSQAVAAEHLLEAGVRAGVSGYDAQCTYVTPFPGLHTGLQIGYAWHSPYVIGFRAGVGLDRHCAGFGRTNYEDSYTVTDMEGDPMQVDYTIGRLREEYTRWSLAFPVQIALTQSHVCLYAGVRMVLPLHASRTERADDSGLSVYYALQDNRVYESYPLAATRSFSERGNGKGQEKAPEWWFAAELCYDIPIHTGNRIRSYLSVGVYMDYCLSPLTDAPSEGISLLMLSDTREGFPLHRILYPVASSFRQGSRLVSSRTPLDAGVKIAYRFAPYKRHSQAAYDCRCL